MITWCQYDATSLVWTLKLLVCGLKLRVCGLKPMVCGFKLNKATHFGLFRKLCFLSGEEQGAGGKRIDFASWIERLFSKNTILLHLLALRRCSGASRRSPCSLPLKLEDVEHPNTIYNNVYMYHNWPVSTLNLKRMLILKFFPIIIWMVV